MTATSGFVCGQRAAQKEKVITGQDDGTIGSTNKSTEVKSKNRGSTSAESAEKPLKEVN